MARALREAKRAHGLCALVLVRREEVVQSAVANVFHKPFATGCASAQCPKDLYTELLESSRWLARWERWDGGRANGSHVWSW